MWIVITAVGVVALIVVLVVRSSAPGRSAPDPDDQPEVTDPTHHDLPEPGEHRSAHRPDGSPVPGSEEDRNRHGQA